MSNILNNFATGITWIFGVIIGMLLLYVIIRVITLATFTSWWQVKTRLYKNLFFKREENNKKGGHNHANSETR